MIEESTIERQWYLEGFVDLKSGVWRTELHPFPFVIGRRPGVQVRLEDDRVSGEHAEISMRDGNLWVRDLDSTNGTMVNGRRIVEAVRLAEGDLVQIGDRELRVVSFDPIHGFRTTQIVSEEERRPGTMARLVELADLVRAEKVEVHFQPIVRFPSCEIEGYEVLGRGELGGKAVSPLELLLLAEGGGLVEELSALFRSQGLSAALELPNKSALFFNTHPAEVRAPSALLESLRELRRRDSDRPLVLEIHEVAVGDIDQLKELCIEIAELDVDIAFDDFGTGQDRLIALAEVHPRFVKFDVRLVRDLHAATRRRRGMVERLVEMVEDLGIEALAEGIESWEEAEACRRMRFHLAQGYYFGRPALASAFSRA